MTNRIPRTVRTVPAATIGVVAAGRVGCRHAEYVGVEFVVPGDELPITFALRTPAQVDQLVAGLRRAQAQLWPGHRPQEER